VTGNTVRDIQLTFGTRADLQTYVRVIPVRCDGAGQGIERHHVPALTSKGGDGDRTRAAGA